MERAGEGDLPGEVSPLLLGGLARPPRTSLPSSVLSPDKGPQTGWLTTTGTVISVLEARGSRSRCQQGWFLLEALREKPFWPLSWLPLVSGIPLSFLGLYLDHFISSSVITCFICPVSSVSLLPFLERHQSHWIQGHPTHPTPVRPHLNSLYLQRRHFQTKFHFEVLGGRGFWGTLFKDKG